MANSPILVGSENPTASRLEATVVYGDHGFALMDAIYYNGTNWVKARADDVATVAQAIVVNVEDANTFTYAIMGRYTGITHGLSVGVLYYLSETTSGLLANVEPTISQPVVYTESSTAFIVFVHRSDVSLESLIITDHGDLDGLSDDDHPQYLNEDRADVRYYDKVAVDGFITNHTHLIEDIIVGDIPDSLISESSVAQHQAALEITESQVTDLQSYLLDADGSVLVDGIEYVRKDGAWVAASGGGGNGKIFIATINATDGEFDFTGIPSGYKRIIVCGEVRSGKLQTVDFVHCYFNGLFTDTDYYSELVSAVNAAISGSESVSPKANLVTGANGVANFFSHFQFTIENYDGSVRLKSAKGHSNTFRINSSTTSGELSSNVSDMVHRTLTAPITRLTFRGEDPGTASASLGYISGTLHLYGEF